MNGFGFIEYKDSMDARDVVPGSYHALTFTLCHHARSANSSCSFPYVLLSHTCHPLFCPQAVHEYLRKQANHLVSCFQMLTYTVGCFQMDPSLWVSVWSFSSLVVVNRRQDLLVQVVVDVRDELTVLRHHLVELASVFGSALLRS